MFFTWVGVFTAWASCWMLLSRWARWRAGVFHAFKQFSSGVGANRTFACMAMHIAKYHLAASKQILSKWRTSPIIHLPTSSASCSWVACYFRQPPQLGVLHWQRQQYTTSSYSYPKYPESVVRRFDSGLVWESCGDHLHEVLQTMASQGNLLCGIQSALPHWFTLIRGSVIRGGCLF